MVRKNPGVILKLQRFNRIIKHLNAGGTVYFCTMTRAIKVSRKHIPLLRVSKVSGSMYINRDCVDYCGIKFA